MLKEILITFFTAMVPVVELRGAIPLGVSLGLSHLGAMVISIVGNLIPVPFIILFIREIFSWIRKHIPKLNNLITKIEDRAHVKSEKVLRLSAMGLFLFVAIPLPGTGAWTGALIAALLNMRLKSAMPAISLGVLAAGILVTGITFGFVEIFT